MYLPGRFRSTSVSSAKGLLWDYSQLSARATEFEGLTVGGFTSGGLFQDGLIVWQVSAGSLQEASVLIFAGIFTALLELPSLHGNRARIPRDLGGSCHFYDLTLQVAHHIYSILLTTYNHLASLGKRNMEGCEYEEVRAVGGCRRLALLFSSLFPTTLKSGMWTIADYQCVKFVDLSQVQNYKNTV